MGHCIGLLQKMYHIIRIYLSIYIRAKNRADSVKVEGQQLKIIYIRLSMHAVFTIELRQISKAKDHRVQRDVRNSLVKILLTLK